MRDLSNWRLMIRGVERVLKPKKTELNLHLGVGNLGHGDTLGIYSEAVDLGL